MFYAGIACITGAALLRSCCGECCEPKDEWKIDDEVRPGELGAGWLYKRGKGAAIWSKRFFVLTEHKLNYYTEEDRAVLKGSIMLAGATARISSTRANAKKKYYFTISHPECGVREFYAKSNNRRSQWLERITDAAGKLESQSHYGKLLKQGEYNKSAWRERWCVCSGTNFEYFEGATETNPKGTIDLINAKIREYSTKDQKFCFEIVAAGSEGSEKKSTKKYIFAAEKDHLRAKWVEVLRKVSELEGEVVPVEQPVTEIGVGSNGKDRSASNPMQPPGESRPPTSTTKTVSSKAGDAVAAVLGRSSVNVSVKEMGGYLEKKSPALLKGWQKRWFALKSSGEIFYYDTEKDCIDNMQPKGVIEVSHLVKNGKGAQVVNKREVHLTLKDRVFELRAKSPEDAKSWIDAINAAMKALGGISDEVQV